MQAAGPLLRMRRSDDFYATGLRQRSARAARAVALPPPFDGAFPCRICGTEDALSPPPVRPRRGAQRRNSHRGQG